MNRRNANWMAIVAGAGVLCSAAWVLAEEAAAPAAAPAAAEPNAEVKPDAVTPVPAPESPLVRLQAMTRESSELKRTIQAKEAKLLTEKPDLQKKLDAADEKMKALQAELAAAQATKQNVFCEADPELKALYERQTQLRTEMQTVFRRRPAGPLTKPGEAPAAVPHVHTEGEAPHTAK